MVDEAFEQRRREAERALRRGDLSEAHQRLQALLAEAPATPGLRERLEAIESMLPAHERPAAPPAGSDPAEAAVARGDLRAALALVRARLDASPGDPALQARVQALQIDLLDALLARIRRRKRLA